MTRDSSTHLICLAAYNENGNTEVLISPYSDQEGNKLQRQKILMFIYPTYNHNWKNISTIYIRGLEL